MKPVRIRDFRPTSLDPPISVFLPESRRDWFVVAASNKNMPDRRGSEVHRFGHWGAPDFYVRIKECT